MVIIPYFKIFDPPKHTILLQMPLTHVFEIVPINKT